MATYWKEIVNFDGEYKGIQLQISVENGVGVCSFDCGDILPDGSVLLLTREGSFACPFEGGVGKLDFQTAHREYCVRIYRGETLVCGGGNSRNLKHEFSLPKINATDTFEERVADFNYFETELGDRGKSLDSILGSTSVEKDVVATKVDTCENISPEVEKNDVVFAFDSSKPAKIQVEKAIVEEATELIENIAEEIKEDIAKDGSEVLENQSERKFEIKPETKDESEKITPQKAQPRAQSSKGKSGGSRASQSKATSSKANQRGKRNKEGEFFSLAKPQVERMLNKFPREEFLEDLLENSKWVKVEFAKGVSYAVGIVYADDMVGYIGYAMPGMLQNPPKFENPQFLPFDIENPSGEGYFLVFQRADTGEKV